jgi:hypothetical protein
MRTVATLAFLLLLGTVTSAGEKTPSREVAIRTLTDFYRSLEDKDLKKALTYLKFPKDIAGHEDEVIQELKKLVGSSEISKKGIEILGKKGKWAPLAELQSKDEAKRMSFGLPADRCFGLFMGTRQGAAFYWDGSRLLMTYFNNIGRLENE